MRIEKVCNFCELTRAYSLPMSVSAFLVAFCAAHKFMPENFWLNSLLILAVVALLHLAGNLFDDYLDIRSYIKRGIDPKSVNFKNPMKARLILDGTYSMASVRKIIAVMLGISFLVGVYFTIIRGWSILLIAALTLLLGWIYPKSAKYGLQEAVIGLMFGPLLVCSTYFALMGHFSFRIYNFSIAIGIFTSILLLAHNIMDYEYDAATGKKTLPVLLKNKNKAIKLILVLILLGAGIYIYTKAKFCMGPVFYIPVLCIIPVAKKLITSLQDYICIRDVKLEPKWYYGIMENWENISQTQSKYFMFRFYLARNLSLIFNTALAVCLFFAFDPIRDLFFMDLNTIMKQFGF